MTLEIRKHSKPFKGFKLTTLELCDPSFAPFSGLSFVQLSDLHFGPITREEIITKAISITNELKPDIIFLTGDYVQRSRGPWLFLATSVNPKMFKWKSYLKSVGEYTKMLAAHLTSLHAPKGIFGVFGNHDHLDGLSVVKRHLPQSITWLQNESVSIKINGTPLSISGTDDYTRGRHCLATTVKTLDYDAPFKVLLSHNPDITLHGDAHLIDTFNLVLCGHTHGGQIRAPFLPPLITMTKQRTHVSGLSLFNNTPIYVSNGIGFGGISLRLFCPPEITRGILKTASREL